MGQREEIAPRQEYRGWTDIESVEYNYPRKGSTKYVLRITLVGGISGYKEMLRVIKENPDSDDAWEYYVWLGSKWNEKFFPDIDTAIALNELNHL